MNFPPWVGKTIRVSQYCASVESIGHHIHYQTGQEVIKVI